MIEILKESQPLAKPPNHAPKLTILDQKQMRIFIFQPIIILPWYQLGQFACGQIVFQPRHPGSVWWEKKDELRPQGESHSAHPPLESQTPILQFWVSSYVSIGKPSFLPTLAPPGVSQPRMAPPLPEVHREPTATHLGIRAFLHKKGCSQL